MEYFLHVTMAKTSVRTLGLLPGTTDPNPLSNCQVFTVLPMSKISSISTRTLSIKK